MANSGPGFLVPPAGGDRVWEGPIGTVVKIPAARTDGLLSICEMPVAPGFMVPPHTHQDTDEWSYVLEGPIGARIGDEELVGDSGSWILKPRGLMHTFWNVGPSPARIIEILTPGRFEEFFRRSAQLARVGILTDELLASLGDEYGTSVAMDWVDDLASRYGLEVTI